MACAVRDGHSVVERIRRTAWVLSASALSSAASFSLVGRPYATVLRTPSASEIDARFARVFALGLCPLLIADVIVRDVVAAESRTRLRRGHPEYTVSCPSRSATSGPTNCCVTGRFNATAPAMRSADAARRDNSDVHPACDASSFTRASVDNYALRTDEAGNGLTMPFFFARSCEVARTNANTPKTNANANDTHAVVVASDARKRRDSIEAKVCPDASRMSSALFGTSDRMRIGSGGRMYCWSRPCDPEPRSCKL